jgi:hypothetical protein
MHCTSLGYNRKKVLGICEHDIEISGSKLLWKFLEWMNNFLRRALRHGLGIMLRPIANSPLRAVLPRTPL